MKVYVKLKSLAITKVETEQPFYQGEENVNSIRVLFDQLPDPWVPTIRFLLPNGMKVGPMCAVQIEDGHSREVKYDGNLNYYFDFHLSINQGVLAIPGLLQMTLTLNDLDGKNTEEGKSISFVNMVVHRSSNSGLVSNKYEVVSDDKDNSFSNSVFSNIHIDINLTVNGRQTHLNFVEGQALLSAPEDGCVSLHAGVIELIPLGSNKNMLTLTNESAKLDNSNIINELMLLEKLKDYISLGESTFIGEDKNLNINFIDYRLIDSIGYPIKTNLNWDYKQLRVTSSSNVQDSDVLAADARMEIVPGKIQLIGAKDNDLGSVRVTHVSAEMECYSGEREARILVGASGVDITVLGKVGDKASVRSNVYISPNGIEVTRTPKDNIDDYSIVLPENNKLLGTKDFTLSDQELDEIFMGVWE